MLDRIAILTGNVGKAAEHAAMLGIDVTPAKAELTEVQSLDVVAVAARKAADAYAQLGQPVLVDDTGLAIHAWNGLPGALVAWFLDTVGLRGILDMAAGITDRRATATAALGYADATGVRVFHGIVDGTLATELRGTSGFGYDPRLHPRWRHRLPHLGEDDRRGEEQGPPPQARRRGNAQRPRTPVTSLECRRGVLPELSAADPGSAVPVLIPATRSRTTRP
jgi:non-canonical purine NTP pyrophosphatase (RdgB/HAM1 family)